MGVGRYGVLPILFLGLFHLIYASYDQEALERHNYFRRAHNAQQMTLNAQMSRSAQAYAEKLARRGSLSHSSSSERPGQGENLAMTCGRAFNGATAVDMWYKEVCQYDFRNPRYISGTGHFTQIVWKGSTELGIGVASKDGRWGKCYYVVGRYRAAGNMMGSFGRNVEQGCFDKNSYCRNDGEPCGGNPPATNAPPPTPPPPQPPTQPPAPCNDNHQHCDYWQKNGYCSSYKDYMMKNCPKACKFCGGGDGGSTGGGGAGGGSGGSGGSGGGNSYAEDGVRKHNEYRRIHNAPAMRLNSEMTREAEEYAAKIARMGKLQHSNSRDGENLAMSCGRELTASAATEMWYKEVCDFDFNNGGFSGRTGHFTQVVWKGSTELGIGKATKGRCTYVVGRYRRAGNYRGQYRQNVDRGSFNKQNYCKGSGGGGGGGGNGWWRGKRR